MAATPREPADDPPAWFDDPPPPYAALPPYMAGPGCEPAPTAIYHHGPAPGLGYSGFWIRAVAGLVDVGALLVLAGLAHLRGIDASCAPGKTFCDYPAHATGLGVVIGVLGLYWVVTWSAFGCSLAQALFGLRVLNAADGHRISILRASGRYLVCLLALVPFGAGLAWSGLDAQKQGWHDQAAGTFVVRRLGHGGQRAARRLSSR